GIVEDPEVAVAVLLIDDHRDRVGHRAQMDGDVLRLHHQLPRGIEEGRRAVVALGDVRRVGGADQHGAHLVAGGPERAGHHLEGDGVEPGHELTAVTVPDSSTVAFHPRGRTSVASGSSKTHGPAASKPASGSPWSTRVVTHSPSKRASRSPSVSSPPAAARGRGSGPGSAAATRIVTSSSLPPG